MPETDIATAIRLAVATLAGLAVGIEREWSGHATGPDARFAGARTFLLLGFIGGVAGWLLDMTLVAAATVILAGAASLAVAAYVMASRPGGEAVDGTTEAAALAVLAVGVMAGLGRLQLAAGAAALMVLVLREKGAIHQFVAKIGKVEMQAGLQFAVLALVLLPLLPAGPFGPYGGIEPRKLWTVVLFLCGLNFVGYLARRVVGKSRGYTITGLLGGINSSTAVTLSFARLSREDSNSGPALALGVIGACTVLLPRVLIFSLALNPPLARAAVPFLVPPLVVGALWIVLGLRRSDDSAGDKDTAQRNPLRLGSAILMALAFQLALTSVAIVRHFFGDAGVLPSAALLGLADMDALTLAMNRLGSAPEQVQLGARALAIGVLSNTVVKLVIAGALGRGQFRTRAALGMVVLGLASGAALWVFW